MMSLCKPRSLTFPLYHIPSGFRCFMCGLQEPCAVLVTDVHSAINEIAQQAHLLAVRNSAPQERLLLVAICNEIHYSGKVNCVPGTACFVYLILCALSIIQQRASEQFEEEPIQSYVFVFTPHRGNSRSICSWQITRLPHVCSLRFVALLFRDWWRWMTCASACRSYAGPIRMARGCPTSQPS